MPFLHTDDITYLEIENQTKSPILSCYVIIKYWEIQIDKLRKLIASIIPNYDYRCLIYFLCIVNFC